MKPCLKLGPPTAFVGAHPPATPVRRAEERITPRHARVDEETLAAAVRFARLVGIDRDARSVLGWAHELLGDQLMMTTSFQKSGMVILHILRDVAPGLPVYFLDTGFHFAETLEFAERIRFEWGVNLTLHRPSLYGDAFRARYGSLYESDPDRCCSLNKVAPQRELLARHQGWIAGVRRDQSDARGGADFIELLEGGSLKIQPLASWTRADVEEYLRAYKIPVHPLFAHGYSSIGCAPCTQPSSDPNDERAGRWVGRAKSECGLHTMFVKAQPAGAEAEARTA